MNVLDKESADEYGSDTYVVETELDETSQSINIKVEGMETKAKSLVLEDKEADRSPMMSQGAYNRKDESSFNEGHASPMQEAHCHETVLTSNNLNEDVQYVTNNNEQTVTIVYPQSALPLLSANSRSIVNLVELPSVEGVDGSLELDSSLEYQGSVVIQHGFENDGQIAVMTTNANDGQLELLEAHAIQSSNDDSVTYFKTTNVESLNASSEVNDNSILSEQLIHIPTSEVVANGHTITLPLSFVSDSRGVSLLHRLSHLPLTIGQDNQGTISMPVNIQPGDIIPNNDADGQSYILSNISPSMITDHEISTEPITTKNHIVTSFTSKSNAKLDASKSVVRSVKSGGQVGRPPKIQQNKKVIGSGPSAISAQGVVQEIGNRLVTVLPRPEDLKKLMDNKQLVFTVRGSSNAKLGSKRKYHLPVRTSLHNTRRGKSRGALKKELEQLVDESNDIVVDITLPGGNPASAVLIGGAGNDEDLFDEDFTPKTVYFKRGPRKRKRGRGRGRGTYVISSTGRRPGRPKKVKTLMQGPNGPRVIQTGPNSTNSTKLEQQEYRQLESDSNEERDNTGILEDATDSLAGKPSQAIQIEALNVNLNSNINGTHHFLNECDSHNVMGEEIEESKIDDGKRRKLPPRIRGTRYQKMIQALKKHEYDDDDDVDAFMDDEDDISPDFLTYKKPPAAPKPKGTSGPGKRGRPRKDVSSQMNLSSNLIEVGGTKIIQLNESLKPIQSTNSPSVLIRDENTSYDGDGSNLQHKLVITFEQPDTGEMVVQQISIQPSSSNKEEILQSCIMTDPTTNISLVPSNKDLCEEESTTIFVKEDGQYEQGYQCEECGETTQFKRDHIRHLRQKHNLRPYECERCGKTFTSKYGLQDHLMMHELEKPHRCNHCGKGFNNAPDLKIHLMEHSSETPYDCDHCGRKYANIVQLQQHISMDVDFNENKCNLCNQSFPSIELLQQHSNCFDPSRSYACDICKLQFESSSGLNRHRKVHNRSSSPGVDEEVFRCSTCQASFSYEKSLIRHIRIVHDGLLESDIKSEFQNSYLQEDSVIEQLQDKLNEGYAPKTSELYDEPKEGETMELTSKDPFLCGICDEPFKDIDVLCDHYTSCHTGDQILYCNTCSVGCSFEYQLEKHKHIHLKEEKQALVVESEEMPYNCSFCGKGFKKTQELEKHSKLHVQQKQFKCSFCSASFPIKSALDKHVLVHTGQRPYVCDICLKSFRQSAALVRHKLWTHRLKNQNKCEICGKTFFTKSLLLYHLDTHGEEGNSIKSRLQDQKESAIPFLNEESSGQVTAEGSHYESPQEDQKKRICEYCGKECSSFVALLTHKITHKLSASYKCDLCHRTFREKRYLKKHRLTHKGIKMWKCDICTNAFATKLTLIRHSHVHLREALRPDPKIAIVSEGDESFITSVSSLPTILRCEECNINFLHKSHYVRHKLLHSGIPLLKCGLCDKMFVHKSDIIRHKVMHSFMFTCNVCGRNFHKRSLYILHKKRHMDAKPFKCEKCTKCFATSGNLKIHQRIHSGEKPYQCNICSYRCSQSGRLIKHKRMHSGEKSASCGICGKSFANTESLKSHQRVHTGERPFRCENCHKSFINGTSLNQHLRDHVKEEMYKCELCPHKFRRSEYLEKHKLFHQIQQQFQENSTLGLEVDSNVESPLYMCEVCGRVFDKKKYLYTHHNVHSRQRVFSCSICGKHLASRLALKNHLMIHSGETPHKCNFCEKEFRSLSNLKRHEKVHCNQEMLNCEECGETFYSSELLNEHKQAHVNLMMMNSDVESVNTAVNQQLYVFDTVDDSMNEAMDTTQQLLVENSQQQFLVDNSQSLLVFPESNNESYTEITHDNSETNHSVEEESPLSPSNDELEEEAESPPSILPEKVVETILPEAEEEREEVDKPHQCDVCMKSFAKKQYLTKHKYRHREVKPHACDVCGKRFAQKFEVAVHKIKHTGERPYHCDICSKEFRSKVNLVNHRMRHTGEYPYLCSVCSKGLSTQLQLERHVSLHTGAHPFRCEICHKGYFQRVSLIKHLTKGHNIQVSNNFETSQSLENSDVVDNLEVMRAISTIANMPQPDDKHSLVELVNREENKTIKQEVGMEVEMEEMDISVMEEDLEDTQFSVVHVQQEYLKSCLLDAPQEIDAKFLTSILQQVRVEGTDVTVEDSHEDHDDSDE